MGGGIVFLGSTCQVKAPPSPVGGPGGTLYLPGSTNPHFPLALFSWTARRPILFPGGKENGGPKALPLGEDKVAAFGHKEKFGRALRGTARPRRAPPSCGETFPGSKKKKAAAGPLFLDLSAYFMKRMAVLAIMSFSPASSNWMRRSISPPMGVTSTIFPGPKALCRMCIPGRKSGNGALWGA